MLSKVLKFHDQQRLVTKDKNKVEQAIITQVSKPQKSLFKLPNLFCIDKCLNSLYKSFTCNKKNSIPLLPPQCDKLRGRKTLILDLDETLVHTTFDTIYEPDMTLPVRVEDRVFIAYVMKRPGIEEFLSRVCDLYEVVVFTASMREYAEPLMKLLDPYNRVSHVLYRESCTIHRGKLVKDLSRLGRNLQDVILVDNSPVTFKFQPENAYHIKDFFDNKTDNELERLLPFLELLIKAEDVRPISKHWENFQKADELSAEPSQPKAKVSFVSRSRYAKNPNPNHEPRVKSAFGLQAHEKLNRQLRPGEAEALRVIRNLKMKRSRQIESSQLEGAEDMTGSKVPTMATIEETDADSVCDNGYESDFNNKIMKEGEQILGENILNPSLVDDKMQFSPQKPARSGNNKLTRNFTLKSLECTFRPASDTGSGLDSQNKLLEAETDNEDKASQAENESIQDLSYVRETLNVNSPVSKSSFQNVLSKHKA